jgi:hypothetical protein
MKPHETPVQSRHVPDSQRERRVRGRLWNVGRACSWCDHGAIIEWRGRAYCRWHWELARRYGVQPCEAESTKE